jgi:hypothetical protein
MTKGEVFPFNGNNPQELHGALKGIPIYDELNFDTHSTSGEHALKEEGTWYEYRKRIEAQGSDFSSVEDPFSYYLQQGPGKFYRAFMVPGDPLVAGMTITPNEQGGYTMDSCYGVALQAIAASAFSRILTRKLIQEDLLMYKASNLTIPKHLLVNRGLARAVMELGIVSGDDLVIPTPGKLALCKPGVTEEELKEVRDKWAQEEVTGVFEYDQSFLGDRDMTIEQEQAEYYRRGNYIGRLTTRGNDVDRPIDRQTLTDAEGNDVRFRFSGYGLSGAVQHVLALKDLAMHSQLIIL